GAFVPPATLVCRPEVVTRLPELKVEASGGAVRKHLVLWSGEAPHCERWRSHPARSEWYDISRVEERDEHAGPLLWERVKAAAREALASDHRATGALEWDTRAWERASLLAARQAFREEVKLQGALRTC